MNDEWILNEDDEGIICEQEKTKGMLDVFHRTWQKIREYNALRIKYNIIFK